MAFSELIKNFDKIRDYMRDFYVYGFKIRSDFNQKSLRTYDNEKRRIESYMHNYLRWDHSRRGKHIFISLDSSQIRSNPLYAAWKSKSFTDRDIILHFHILSTLKKADKPLDISTLTDKICEYSKLPLDTQVIRIKANEYVKEGILNKERIGKTDYYLLAEDFWKEQAGEGLLSAVKFFQEIAPFGEIGSYILDNLKVTNDIFTFKHHFVVHTLEDDILLTILKAIREKREICFINRSTRLNAQSVLEGVPMKILVSAQTGRRYVCIYNKHRCRFMSHRLDYIKFVEINNCFSRFDELHEKLENILPNCWGVSFGNKNHRIEILCVKLFIDEVREKYVLDRLKREGRNGEILRLDKNIYLYTKETYDTNEMMSWVKSFTGRIISIEGTNRYVINKFYDDMKQMAQIYGGN